MLPDRAVPVVRRTGRGRTTARTAGELLAPADCVVSGGESTGLYAATINRPILLETANASQIVTNPPLARVTSRAERQEPETYLRSQIDTSIRRHRPGS